MDINEMTFGVEFETILPAGTIDAVGCYHAGIQIAGLPIGWNAQRDGSIQAGLGAQGVEIVSPILKGSDGLDQIVFVLKWLKQKGARVNQSTGLHVHVGFRGDEKALAVVVTCVANYEKALYASTGTHSRETGVYCRPIQTDGVYQSRFRDGLTPERSRTGLSPDRYRVLNLRNVLGGGKPTIEFRVFAGTLNVKKVVSYVRICLGLVERASMMKRKTKWVAKKPVETSPLNRKGGEGQTAMCRLFYGLGWTKGQAKAVFGNLTCDAVSIEAGKKELMRLARKYDQREE
jgi:hypothetical protein